MMKEEWKIIYLDGHESIYEVSNFGNIKNRETGICRAHNVTPNGYARVCLYYHGKIFAFSIHRIVAEYFVPNKDIKNCTQVDHIDGNKLNNCASNLEWVTPKENKRRAIDLGLCNPHHGHQKKGSESGVAKHTEEEVRNVCKLLEKDMNMVEIAKQLDLTSDFVRSIKRGRAWKHISKDYNIPETKKIQIHDYDTRKEIEKLIDKNIKSDAIARMVGLPDPNTYGRKYVSRYKSFYLRDKGSTTIDQSQQ